MTLTNGSKLPCKCEVMGQESRSQGLATFTTSPNSGVIPAKGTLDVEITLQASRLGRIQLPLQIKVCVLTDLQDMVCYRLVVLTLQCKPRRIDCDACMMWPVLPACRIKQIQHGYDCHWRCTS